jgi:protein TonB
MKNSELFKLIATFVLSTACALAQSQPASPNAASTPPAPRRVQVDADTASTMIVQKAPMAYPEAARKAGIQGKVTLRVVTSYSGVVKEVTVVSGDPALARAAVDAVKQIKYKPYLADGLPAEMETQVSFNFQIKAPAQPDPPPLGTFRDDAYSNSYFGIYYPLSRDWVLATEAIRKRMAADGSAHGTYVLLSALRIPQNAVFRRADSEFTVLAASRSGTASPGECKQYLEAVADDLHLRREGKLKGDLSQFTVAGHDFYRGGFEFRHGIDHRTFLCTLVKDYRLQWDIAGWSKQAIETAVSTLGSITAAAPATTPQSPPAAPATVEPSKSPASARVAMGVMTGLLIKKVQPVYPPEAKYAHIQGTVVLQAVISKTGDVVDLEVVSGPIELVVSAVNAVRKWKYRPYLLMGKPVAVSTQIVVNYVLQF